MARRWGRPPQTDETGRLAPEVLARARRRVGLSLLGLVIAILLAGLLAYACDRAKSTKHHSAPGPVVESAHFLQMALRRLG